jgi:hypothetical protein
MGRPNPATNFTFFLYIRDLFKFVNV